MQEQDIYGKYGVYLPKILEDLSQRIQEANDRVKQETGQKLFEHFNARIKQAASMEEKCQRKNLPRVPESALKEIRDAIGIRIVCGFIEDIYQTIEVLRQLEGCEIVLEKDYIRAAKPNGYRSYHLILEVETPYEDCHGQNPGRYFVEIQLRTIAMDSWASLEHQMKYKHEIKDSKRIVRELKRCADELASCDVTMQTIRNLIRESE
ncbi:GTP pyrophosphokinase [Streptococcus sanguinis]|uniref:RelA/SpoT domain protein n=2 Tax=Streptococcus sanguinis TaxID=1305 RepID=F3UTX1_STRSA|nr:GTP pyrophosphokinase [Streptococcus sanguinis]EGJ36063.1 RelA/SpoT domain protein [Streptococcus sanguinis SK355]MBZ2020876.1 GTP pyrophosphokinase family protein [Streptococcus sanguinis]MBZ2038022.1 GTP pyrophosphokinase family protein [Streptococcus sanguinis]MBZ2069447.1 GTP pyrophosphokinase family protein [Streptococcus sanguinis]MBZ2071418.1 GTP pyrophosphokinase family protein [Streptococcus sanguinis]